MTKSVICIFLYCFLFSLFAEGQTQDTIIDNKPYAIHIVQPRETLYGISRQYNAELNDLVVSNPIVIQGLHVGFKLLVPLRHSINLSKNEDVLITEDTTINETFKTDTLFSITDSLTELVNYQADSSLIKVALLLPYYLDFNDSLNTNYSKPMIYPKSKVALDFHFGFHLAIDSLESLGYNIDLMVLDVPNDSVFESILASNVLYDREYIFGPIYIRQFEELAKFYGYDSERKLISPLSYKSVVNNYLNIYQPVPLTEVQIDTMVKVLLKKHKEDELIIFGQEEEMDLFSYSKRKLSLQIMNKRCQALTFNKADLSDRDLLKGKLRADKNVLIVPSNDRSFVSRLLPMLGSMEDTSFTIYGLDTWNRFDNLDYYDLVNLNVHLPSVFMDDGSEFYNDFLLNYFNKYYAYPQKYAYSAYQQCLYFLSDEFNHLLNFDTFNQTTFQSNSKFDVVQYVDFERVIVD